jgi:diguanylate cyclase (GGDEF)-like protein
MVLDQAMLVAVASVIIGFLGLFLLVLWSQERGRRALARWGAAYLLGAFTVTLWGAGGAAVPQELPSMLLFVACGMIWNGARLFQNRQIRPVAPLFGAMAWLIAMQFPDFVHSGYARLMMSSAVMALYAFLAAFELRRERRKDIAARFMRFGAPLLHGAVFLMPVGLSVLAPNSVSTEGLFVLLALETMIYAIGIAFVIVMMTNERTVLVHKTAAMTDPLTGLFNRRAFIEAANRLIGQSGRYSQPVSLLAFDLDKFKSINDRFGHATGDAVLKVFASTIAVNVRATDVVGRLGGEEFACIIPGNVSDAGIVAERLRAAFQAAGEVIAGHAIGATVSIGVATTSPSISIEALLSCADAALYRAKHNGRNRIEFDNIEPPKRPALQPIPALGQAVAALR